MPMINVKDVKQAPWRVLVYGKPGVGKTYLGKYLTGKTMMLSFDGSYKRLTDIYQDSTVWDLDPNNVQQDLADFAREFVNIHDQYDNLVIDNVTSLQDLWFVEKAKESKSGLDNQIQHYNEYSHYVIRFFASMLNYDLNILTTAWEEQRPITAPNGQQFSQYAPSMRDKARDWLMGHMDVVGRLVQSSKSGERGIILQGNDGIYAKNRMDNRTWCKAEDLFKFGDVEEKPDGKE